MLDVMKELALYELNRRFGTDNQSLRSLRTEFGKELAPLLVEAAESVPRVYLLQAVPGQAGRIRMWVEELEVAKARRLPFNKPSGSQSAALGPVLKRTYKPRDSPPFGPSRKIQNTTRGSFCTIAAQSEAWGSYFGEAYGVLFEGFVLEFSGKEYTVGEGAEDEHILAAAVRLIPEKETVFLAVVDSKDRWPGDRPEYLAYLAQVLANSKYVTGAAQAWTPGDCALCGQTGVTLYPNALRGAGVNFGNVDRVGAFPDLDPAQAWKSYGLCLGCADLLYIFKNHLSSQFLARIAGEKALLLPELLGNPQGREQFMEDWANYISHFEESNVATIEELMEFFLDRDDAQVVLHILWAKFGQVIEEVRGYITDVLPSRLQTLAAFNKQANSWAHALAPRHKLEGADFNLALSMLVPLFKRPGGKRMEKANASAQLFALKRQLAETLYHGRSLGKAQSVFWQEVLSTARAYLDEIVLSGNSYGLLYEGVSEKKGGANWWTLAGWIRYLARFLYYLDITGVLPMEHNEFEPKMERLKPYFRSGSGINSPEKAFAFLLGALYGKLLQVQSARKVNVAANALTWLKRLNLSGRDLPALYNKIREKTLAYGMEANADVRALLSEIGALGAMLGDTIKLNPTATCYFLLLGQSVALEILPSKGKTEEDA